MSQFVIPTYSPLPVTFSHGKGAQLWDTNGREYLDALSGIAVTGLGHSHPEIVSTIQEQANKLLHVSNLYTIQEQNELAEKLCNAAGMQQAFFCNSGAEANEAAIKLARLFAKQKGHEEGIILTMGNSFHGRTMSTLSATGNPKIHDGFTPLIKGFMHIPYNDLDAVNTLLTEHDNIVAIMLEPLQGEGGINIATTHYLKEIQSICDQHKLLFIVDEIQTGMGRTGAWFAHQHADLNPDVMTLAKGLGNGLPIGACLVNNRGVNLFTAGKHGSTFGGNPFVTKVAAKVIDIIANENLLANADKMGEYLLSRFTTALDNTPHVVDIRGHGLMIGIELSSPCPELVSKALDNGLLINVTAQKVIRLLPPLIIDKNQADTIADIVISLIKEKN